MDTRHQTSRGTPMLIRELLDPQMDALTQQIGVAPFR